MKEEIRNWAHRLASDSVRCGESEYGEQPVAPAPTASAREWLIDQYDELNPLVVSTRMQFSGKEVIELLEAYASSQAEKLRGVGQQAAGQIWDLGWEINREDFAFRCAAIIDAEIEGRLKK